MAARAGSSIHSVISKHEQDILSEWLGSLKDAGGTGGGRIKEAELHTQCRDFLAALREATGSGDGGDLQSESYDHLRHLLGEVSRARAGWVGPTRSAEARLLYAESTLSRQAMLGDMKVTSEAERDKAASSKLVAEAELLEAREARKTAELELQRARAMLELRTIRSPVNGVVVERMRSPGEYADPPQIVKIAQVDPLSVEVFASV